MSIAFLDVEYKIYQPSNTALGLFLICVVCKEEINKIQAKGPLSG